MGTGVMTPTRIADGCEGAASGRTSHGVGRPMVAAWGNTAGMWSELCLGCTTSVGCAFGRIARQINIRRFSHWVARSSV